MALRWPEAVERSKTPKQDPFSTALLAPCVNPCGFHAQAMHQCSEYSIGIQSTAVFAANRTIVSDQVLLYVVEQTLPQELM